MYFHVKTIRWKNFLSTGNTWTKVDLDKSRTTLIVGANGQGKSTLLDAIHFCLFGKPFRKINKPQLVNATNKSDLLTEIEFEINNIPYKIVRGIKPNVFEIYENGKLLDQDAKTTDYQEYLEKNILRMNDKAFTQIILIGNATYMPFMKLRSYDRRLVVEGFLDIDIFTKMNSKLKERMAATKQLVLDCSWKVDLNKEKLKLVEDSLAKSKTKTDTWIEENKNKISVNETQIRTKKDIIKKYEEKINALIVDDVKVTKLRNNVKQLSDYASVFSRKKTDMSKELNFLENNDVCPTCDQEIDIEFKQKRISTRKKSIAEVEDAADQLEKKLEALNKSLQSHLESQEEINAIKIDILSVTKDIQALEADVERIQKENEKLKQEATNSLAEEQEQFEELKKIKKGLQEERELLLEEQHIQSLSTILLKDDGIKTKIIKHYIPVINKLINKYLQQMDFFINFKLDENFDEIIEQANKEDFSYNSFSEGEKLRIDLAILFAWRELAKIKNSANSNLLILDEVFDSSLDVAGIDDFVRIITSTLSRETNTFIISHKGDTLADKFDNVLKFEKVNGFSQVV